MNNLYSMLDESLKLKEEYSQEELDAVWDNEDASEVYDYLSDRDKRKMQELHDDLSFFETINPDRVEQIKAIIKDLDNKAAKRFLDKNKRLKNEGLNEEILSEPVKDNVRETIEKINDLVSTIKHSVEMDIMSINSQIEMINDKTTLNIDEIEIGDIYSNLSSVKSDLEYALKNSDWSEEEANENE